MGETAAAAIVGASLLTGASAQASAGSIAKMEAEVEARQIETAAAAREADRKEMLARATASQVAGAGGRGITMAGSPLTILDEDIRRATEASERDTLMARLGASAAQTRGRVKARQARSAALTGLLRGGGQMMMGMGGGAPGGDG